MEKTESKFTQPKEGATDEQLENSPVKKVSKKRAVSKKKATKKKTTAKKAVPKKQTAKKKAVSNKGAVSDEKKIAKLTKLLTRKKGCGSAEVMDKLNVSRVTALKMINNTKAKKIAHGVFKI